MIDTYENSIILIICKRRKRIVKSKNVKIPCYNSFSLFVFGKYTNLKSEYIKQC